MENLVETYCFVDSLVNLIDSKKNKSLVGGKGILSKRDYIVLAILKQS